MKSNVGRVINSCPMKMSLSELKRQINLDKKNWKHILTTNCYAFSLGLDVPERKIKTFAYAPGTIGSSPTNLVVKRFFTLEDLIANFQDDLIFMGISFGECNPLDKIEDNEWKVALFTAFYAYVCYEEYFYDFHFMRQGKNGVWFHKTGFYHRPTNLDSNKEVIYDPRDCTFKNYDYQLTYKLRLK